MKATGTVRRIDDLGRVVIPKEVRRKLRWREGDPVEIFIDPNKGVILKKYSPIGELDDFAKEYADSLYESTGHIALICDSDNVIAVSGGPKSKYLYKSVDEYGDIENRKIITGDRKVFCPIVVDEGVIGAVILLADENYKGKFSNLEFKIAEVSAGFLAKQMESD